MDIADSDLEAEEQMKGRVGPIAIASRNFRFTFEGKAVPQELQELSVGWSGSTSTGDT